MKYSELIEKTTKRVNDLPMIFSWRLVIEVTAMVAMMLFASYVEGTVPVWAR